MLSLEVVRDLSRLHQIVPEWQAFVDETEGLSPFQTPDWLLTWWLHFGSGVLQVLVFRTKARVAGIVPCFLHHWNGRKQLTLIGSGISDFLEPAIHPEHCAAVICSLRRHLQSDADWEICDWQDLDSNSPLLGLQRTESWNVECSSDTICSEVTLDGSFEQFWNKRPKDLRRNQRRYTERAAAMGPLRFDVSERADDELLNALIALHAERWQKRGEPGMIAANQSAEFLRSVVPVFATKNRVRWFSLQFRGKLVAIILTFVFRNKIFSYLSAVDTDHEILGFGRILLHHAIEHCYQNGVAVWNFLRGDERYKFSWGAQAIAKMHIRLSRIGASADLG